MKNVDRNLEKIYESWFPMLSAAEDAKVRAGFEEWLQDNYVREVAGRYEEKPDLLIKSISVLVAPLGYIPDKDRADYLKLYPYQKRLMTTVREIWDRAKVRYVSGERISAEAYGTFRDELFTKFDRLKEVMAETAGAYRANMEDLESDIFLDLEYAKGNTELMSRFLEERLE